MSVIYDALKKLQDEITEKRRNNPENSQTSPLSFTKDTAVFPSPRIPKFIIAATKAAEEATKSTFIKTNPTITNALKSQDEKKYQKIMVAICAATCAVLIFSIVYLSYLFVTSRSAVDATEPSKAVPTVKKNNELISLQGIATMDNRQVALINDEMYEVGETVRGRKIVAIYADRIDIQDHRRKIKTIYVKQKKQ